MTRPEGPNCIGFGRRLLELLRDAGAQSSTFVDEILDTLGVDGRYGGTDGREALTSIMRSLVALTGSEEAAVEWLFNSRGYSTATGNDAYLALESGDFWSLTVMADWLHILQIHRVTCPELIVTLFGTASFTSTAN